MLRRSQRRRAVAQQGQLRRAGAGVAKPQIKASALDRQIDGPPKH